MLILCTNISEVYRVSFLHRFLDYYSSLQDLKKLINYHIHDLFDSKFLMAKFKHLFKMTIKTHGSES